MRFDSLEAWLEWQETLNPRGIELGLERVRRVLQRLPVTRKFRVLTIGGTNGKGSVATYAAAVLQSSGFKVGRYLSPHILRYNERIAINGVEVSDTELCESFEAVDRARHDESLTYFEFGTLAALELFSRHEIDVAVLEVGLGGRLDAVNVIDPDAAVVVSVGLDHVEWLGNDVGQIAREKAGIFRSGRPAICGMRDAPPELLAEARRMNAHMQRSGEDFDCRRREGGHWDWIGTNRRVENLPAPMAGSHQYGNAAAALAAVLAVYPEIDDTAIRVGIASATLPGRLQVLPGSPEVLLDVGHNADAAARIADYLREHPRPTSVVLGMLADKDSVAFARELAPFVDNWHFASLPGARGQTAQVLARKLRDAGLQCGEACHPDVERATAAARQAAPASGRVLVTGSFHTVEAFLVYSDLASGSR